jgi:hypothetical protein
MEVIRAKLHRIDETLNPVKLEDPAEWNGERDVASHMLSESETS